MDIMNRSRKPIWKDSVISDTTEDDTINAIKAERHNRSIAHEIKNLFQALKGNLFLANRYILKNRIDQAENEIFRAQLKSVQIDELIHDLCDVNFHAHTTGRSSQSPLDIISALKNTLASMASQIHEGVELVSRFNLHQSVYRISQSTIDRILGIAINNAISAQGHSGQIQISVGLETSSFQCDCCGEGIHSETLSIRIIDTGSEIVDSRTLRLLFKPYYKHNQPGRHNAMFVLEELMHRNNGHVTIRTINGTTALSLFFCPIR